jgi:hypothetical protein
VLALGARLLPANRACSIVDVFLASGFDGGRHQRRIDLIAEIEREECARWHAGPRANDTASGASSIASDVKGRRT